MNHQQRKPTRPPTTTTAATEIPAIAPVERELLLVLEGSHAVFSLFRLYPGLHVQTFALAAELLGQSALQLFPSSCTFWPGVVQSVQVCPAPSPVHVLQLGPPLLSHYSI